MLRLKTSLLLLVTIAIFNLAVSAQVNLVGSEVKVNTTTDNSQQYPDVAIDSAGNHVVVWESFNETNNRWEIKRQLYNADGSANGSEATLFSDASYNFRYPNVSITKTGIHVVSYMEYDQVDVSGYNYGWDSEWCIYNADGSNAISTSTISSGRSYQQKFPSVAASPDGSYFVGAVAHYDSDSTANIYVRQKLSSYATTSSNITANTTSGNLATYPDITIDTEGNFVVVWQYETGNSTNVIDVYGQIFDKDRNKIGSEFLVNTTTSGNQIEPSVAYASDGTFMVVWTSEGQDGDGQGVYGQRFDASGNKVGSEVLINVETSNAQNHANVSATNDGYYNVSWTSYGQDGSRTGVYYKLIKSDGTVVIPEAKLNTRTNDFQQLGIVVQSSHDSDAVAVWMDGLRYSASTHDGDNYGVYKQHFKNKDIEDPIALCKNITVDLNSEGYAVIDSAALDNGSSDNFGWFTVDISKDTVYCSDIGVTTSSFTVTDFVGLTDVCVSSITVRDTMSPTVLGKDISVYLDATGNASILATDVDNGTSDNCSLNSLTISQSDFDCDMVGPNIIVLKADDAEGNEDSVFVTVTVLDTVSPVHSVSDLTVYLDGTGIASVFSSDFVSSSSDNCGVLNSVASDTVFNCADAVIKRVAITTTDVNGNTTIDSVTVNVLDTITPIVIGKNITKLLEPTGELVVDAIEFDNGSSDNCSLTFTLNDSTFDCHNIGENTLILTATDPGGNSRSVEVVMTLHDWNEPAFVNVESCIGDSVLINGEYVTSDGTYNDTLQNVNGCDSLVIKFVSFLPTSSSEVYNVVCSSDSIIIGGEVRLTSGIYQDTLTNSVGCDSIVTVNLTVNPSFSSIEYGYVCEGEMYGWRGDGYSVAGVYEDTYTSRFGCDSVYTLVLNKVEPFFSYHGEAICSNDSVLWRGGYYQEGTYYDSLTSVLGGCDSIYILVVEADPAIMIDTAATVCSNEVFTWRGNNYSDEGVYVVNYTSVFTGCDSSYRLTLSHIPSPTTVLNETICEGDTFFYNSEYLTSEDAYNYKYAAANGCDSNVVINLTVAPKFDIELSATICDGETYLFGGETLTSAGIYNDDLLTINGCDSIITLTLSVTDSIETFDTITVAPFTAVTIHGVSQDSEGTYISSFTSSLGCDSTSRVTLEWELVTSNESLDEISLEVYPTPSSGLVSIKVSHTDKDISYVIIDERGRLIYEGLLNSQITKLDLSGVENGLYYVKFSKGEIPIEVKPIVITK